MSNRRSGRRMGCSRLSGDCLPASRGEVLEMRRTVAGRSLGWLICVPLLVWSFVGTTGFAGENVSAPQNLHVAGLDVAAWIPKHDIAGPWPIIIFSHGFHGCNTESIFLMEGLTVAGYAGFAPQHPEPACGINRPLVMLPEAAT